MIIAEYNRKRLFVICLIFGIVFVASSFLFHTHKRHSEVQQFKTHAKVIAEDVWAMDPTGATTYLRLVQKTDHFKEINVAIPGDEHFIFLPSEPLTGFSGLLFKIGVIRVQYMEEPIPHISRTIGFLSGQQYVRLFVPLINIFLLHLLFFLLTLIIDASLLRRKALEQEVVEKTRNWENSERRFHDLVDLLPEMVLETDLDGRIQYANKQASELLQLTRAEDECFFVDSIDEGHRDRARHMMESAREDRDRGLVELKAIDSSGNRFPVLSRSAPVKHGDTITGIRTIVIDITERHKLEEKLRRDQKMKAIGLMAGGVAHDLNNILSGIVSYPELLLFNMDKSSPYVKPLKAIHKAGLDAREVVSDLLTVARGVVVEEVVEEPNRLIRDYLNSPDFVQLGNQYPLIRFKTELDPEVGNISCAPVHVRKCLMNLITNGAEAIADDGTIVISSDTYYDTGGVVQGGICPQPGRYSRISVSDTGTGIDETELESIFEPFFTKKVLGRSGTGLGLTVVWNTMRDHGGTVTVSSSKRGTRFELYFPCVEIDVACEQPDNCWKKFQASGQKVLVVDDEQAPRELALSVLTQLGYSPAVVDSGEDALSYLATQCVDIVVLDMVMKPGGLTGRKTYEKVLKLHPGQAAVIASGFAEDEDVAATLQMGAAAFVAKPYSVAQMGAALKTALTNQADSSNS